MRENELVPVNKRIAKTMESAACNGTNAFSESILLKSIYTHMSHSFSLITSINRRRTNETNLMVWNK